MKDMISIPPSQQYTYFKTLLENDHCQTEGLRFSCNIMYKQSLGLSLKAINVPCSAMKTPLVHNKMDILCKGQLTL